MAHFAQINENGIVMQVIVVANDELLDADGKENEFRGVAFCQSLFGADTVWMQTSYNGKFRKNYAGIGYKYDAQRDAFIPPQPFASWLLNEETCQWQSTVPSPNVPSYWDEATTMWVTLEPQ